MPAGHEGRGDHPHRQLPDDRPDDPAAGDPRHRTWATSAASSSQTPEGPREREVDIGLSNDKMAEILYGLQEGERSSLTRGCWSATREDAGRVAAPRRATAAAGGDGKGKGKGGRQGRPPRARGARARRAAPGGAARGRRCPASGRRSRSSASGLPQAGSTASRTRRSSLDRLSGDASARTSEMLCMPAVVADRRPGQELLPRCRTGPRPERAVT